MGLELLILLFGALQLIGGLGFFVYDVSRGRRFSAAGVLLGLVIGFLPFLLIQGPAVWGLAGLAVWSSTVVLIVVFGALTRWKPLIATIIILAIPLTYKTLVYSSYPTLLNPTFQFLAFVGELEFMLSPIICALALREASDWLGKLP